MVQTNGWINDKNIQRMKQQSNGSYRRLNDSTDRWAKLKNTFYVLRNHIFLLLKSCRHHTIDLQHLPSPPRVVIFPVISLPRIHPLLPRRKKNPKLFCPINVKQAKERYQALRVGLSKAINNWNVSGNGRFQFKERVGGENVLPREEIYKFKDGDDRASFVKSHGMQVLFWWDMAYKHGMIDSATESFPNEKRSEGQNIQLISEQLAEEKEKRNGNEQQKKKGAYHTQVTKIHQVMKSNALGNQFTNLSAMREQTIAMGKAVNDASEKVHELGMQLLVDRMVPEDELTVIKDSDSLLIRLLKERYIGARNYRDELVDMHQQQKKDVQTQNESVQTLLAEKLSLQTPSKRPSSVAVSLNSKSSGISALSAPKGISEEDNLSHSTESDDELFKGGLDLKKNKRQRI